MSLRRGDDDYYYYIICVIVLRAKAEHALDTRYSADEQRATTTTRVLDGCCVPAGVTLQSSSSYALARSLAHPDRAGEPRTRPPTEDTPHIDRNLARSEPRPPISLTITNRRQGHTSRRYPRAQQHGEAYSPNFREFPSVRWTTAVPIARSGHALLLCRCSPISRFSRYRFIYRVQWLWESVHRSGFCGVVVGGGRAILTSTLILRRRIIYIYMFFVVIIKYHQNRVLLRSNEKASDPPPNTIFSNFLINQKSHSKRI